MTKPAWQQSEYMRYFYKIEDYDMYPSAFHYTIEQTDDKMVVMSAWCHSASSRYAVAYMARKFRTVQEARDAQPRWHDGLVTTMKQRYDEEKATSGAVLYPQTSEAEHAHNEEILRLYQLPMWED